jgi:hypothetical protein
MTIQLLEPPAAGESPVRWMTPASGLWVATRRGEHAGMIERSDGRYHARSARGRALGSFEDLDSARAAVDGRLEGTRRAPRALTAALVGLNGGIAALALVLASAVLR